MEAALANALAPMMDEGYRVLGAPTDHAAVGRVFGKGEIRAAYSGREWQSPIGIGKVQAQASTISFEVILELQDVRMKSHPHAADAIEQVIELLRGFSPEGGCSAGLYPVKDGFVGRIEDQGIWIYSVLMRLELNSQIRRVA
jgi:hypothetical protein